MITLGRSARREHVLVDERRLRSLGIDVREAGRGGDVTFHGPGQLVGYPIVALAPGQRDAHRYLRDLEEALIRTVADFGLDGERVPGRTGVWSGGGKVAALGVRLSTGWIASHGFSLNVSVDLSAFDRIVPCGIADARVTSIAERCGRVVPLETVAERVSVHLAEVLARRPVPASRDAFLSEEALPPVRSAGRVGMGSERA